MSGCARWVLTSSERRRDASIIREVFTPGTIPRFELSDWQNRYGIAAGITGRGDQPGRGFDLGLWGDAPVGEVMSRWRAFRRADERFSAVVLGNQVHGTVVSRIDAAQ